MFTPKIPKEGAILRNYLTEPLDTSTDEDINSFENQYIAVMMPIDTILWFAKNNWKCPNNSLNRQILSEANWRNERQALLNYGKNLKINTKATLCSTFHNFSTSYLIWLEFTGPDQLKHKIDFYINEKSRDSTKTYAIKIIDGIPCEAVYNTIIGSSTIDPRIARKLNSIGSITWSGTAESKTQYKLNSYNQQKLFEKVAADCPFVELSPLDCFDDYLYRGDPGKLADYDLTVTLKDGSKIATRIDLKLLRELNFETIQMQNPHDAEIIIASALLDSSLIAGGRFSEPKSGIRVEETEEFKDFISLFKTALQQTPPQYIKIHNIDTDTGKVSYTFFG
jgi:hypothetical protein